MTPGEKSIFKVLVAVAWADGKVEAPEAGVLEGLLDGFGASADEKRELLAYAGQARTLSDEASLASLEAEDREILLANAAVLTHADGVQSAEERALLDRLVALLGFTPEKVKELVESAREGTLLLSSRALEADD